MQLMFVGHVGGFGGAERVIINLANAMIARKHDIYLISIVNDNPKYKIISNVKYSVVQERGKGRISHIINRYLQLKAYINEIQPDLILCNMRLPAFYCAFMGKKIASKTIYTERNDPYAIEYKGLLGLIRYISFKRLGGFVFQSEAALNCFGDDVKKRSCVINNIVYVNQLASLDTIPRDKRIVTVGRLREQKNHELLIDAFAMLPNDTQMEYKLEIYGEGPLKEKLQNKISALGLADRVFLMGTFSDIHKRIANATMFVFSSDYEGMPNALLEAMGLGLPCISTDYSPGSLREFMIDGVNGLIVPRCDVVALRDAMNKMLNDVQLQNEIGARARDVLKRFTADKIYDEWEQFFYKVSECNKEA